MRTILFYTDGTRAPFSITDVVTVDGGIEFTLNLDRSGISDIAADRILPAYDRMSSVLSAPDARRIDVFNTAGICVISVSETSVSLESLPTGLYFARAAYSGGRTATIKLLK